MQLLFSVSLSLSFSNTCFNLCCVCYFFFLIHQAPFLSLRCFFIHSCRPALIPEHIIAKLRLQYFSILFLASLSFNVCLKVERIQEYVPMVQPYGRFNYSFSWTAKKVYLNSSKKNISSSWASWADWTLYKWPANLAQYEIHWSKLTTFLILLSIRCWNWWRVFWQMWFAWFLNASQNTICVQIIQRHKSVLFIL